MPVPIISVKQMREWEEATWASGQSQEAVMRLAGRALARQAGKLTRLGEFVLIVAGKGHNGDDARFAAESEELSGRELQVLRVDDPEVARNEITPLLARGPALIIDGLFGIGLNRPLSAAWNRLLRAMNESGVPILAVDVPSGLNAETGEAMGEVIQVAHTVTFGAVKEGLLRTNAANFVGRLHVAADIGLTPCPFKTEINFISARDFSGFPPPRPVSGHKGTFGHLAIIAGSLGYHGASVLAARGAQRAQPGLITLLTAENVYHPVAAQLQSVMVRPWTGEMELPGTCTALAVGPGLASREVPEYVRAFTSRAWKESPLAMVADASALEWLPEGPMTEKALRVMTPHPGEAARLLRVSTADVQADRVGATRKLSRQFGNCFVVLKGWHTVIGRAEGPVLINSSGNPSLGQGGSGDLLTGYLGGLLGQPLLQRDPAKTIAFGVWQHGTAADKLQATRPNWTVEELAGMLGSGGEMGE